MATTNFNKPLDDEITTLNSKIKNLDGSTPYVENINPDTFITPGVYSVGIAAQYSPTGSALYGLLEVKQNGGANGLIKQILYRANNVNYERSHPSNGSWNEWNSLNDKFTRHSDVISDNNLGITVYHVHNGSAHEISISGTLTQALAGSTKYELAPSTSLTNFPSYVPAYHFDSGRWGYFYISNNKLCVQFREAWGSGDQMRYVLTWL